MLCVVATVARAGTVVVNNPGDAAVGTPAHCSMPSACTLRDALAAATASDTIAFNVGTNQTITLTSNTTLTLASNVTLDGSGSPGLTIDGNHSVTVVRVNSGVTAAISHLTIANGQASVVVISGTLGGGIYNNGTLTLTNVAISGNAAFDGGGIFNEGTLTVNSSTISGNSAASQGGGIFQDAVLPLILRGSTISGNTAAANGGGIHNSGFLTVVNSTFNKNSAGFFGGGIANEDPLTLVNSTFSGNTSPMGADIDSGLSFASDNTMFNTGCRLSAAITGSGNLDAGTTCGLPPANSNAKLNLGPLQNNGGPTQTMLPQLGSVALDTAQDSVCAATPVNAVDQRGVSRPQGAHCDVGATEIARCYVKADATGTNSGASWANAYIDLQSALANSGCDQIWVARGVYKPTATADRSIAFNVRPNVAVYGGFAGSGILRDPSAYPTVLSGDIDSNDTGTNGVDADTGKIVGNNSYHVVAMDGTKAAGPITTSTILDGFTITGGKASGAAPDDSGGGLYCNGSGAGNACSPTLSNLWLAGNFSAFAGGGLYNNGSNGGTSSPLVASTTFSGNHSANGGGSFQETGAAGGTSSPIYVNDTFGGNSVTSYGGAMYTHIASGSGVVTLTNVTISGNSSSIGGAFAVYGCGGTPTVTLTNVILWADTGPSGSGELVVACDTPTFKNSVVMGSGGSGGTWHSSFGTDGGGNVDADPNLSALQDNGGNAPTMMPLAGSAAIDAGLDNACNATPANAADQRGIPRPLGAHCDIGAIEATNMILHIADGSAFGVYGGTIQYTVTLWNSSPTDAVTGIHVSGAGTAALDADGTLFCRYANCSTQKGGPLDDNITLAPNSLQTWLVNVPVLESSTAATATMAIRSTGAAAVSDVDTLVIFRGTFDSP